MPAILEPGLQIALSLGDGLPAKYSSMHVRIPLHLMQSRSRPTGFCGLPPSGPAIPLMDNPISD